jgi:lipid A 3-O-deacylase
MLPKKIVKAAVVGFALIGWNAACHAIDSASFEFATGNKTQMVRAGLQQNWDRQWLQSNGTHVGGYWDYTLAYWRGNRYRNTDSTQNIADVGITPVFRFQRDDKMGFYAEAGTGAHLLSANYDNNGRRLSTLLEFGTHLGVGYVFSNKLDIALKVQHFSNGGIKQPNNGVNFAVLRVAHTF